MPSIESLLRAWGNQVSGRSLPAETGTEISIAIASETTQYVAPCDGWVHCHINGTDVQSEILAPAMETLSANPYREWGRCFLPIRKGQQVTINMWGWKSGDDAAAAFVPAEAFG